MMKMILNGCFVDALKGEVIDIENPATGEIIATVPKGDAADIDLAVKAAKEGYRINRSIPASERSAYLLKASRLWLEHFEELVGTMILENGKSREWAEFEIKKSAEIFASLAERVKDPQGKTYPMDGMVGCAGQMAMVYRQPRGVIGGIIPFNFPMEMMAYKLGSALCAGNSIVLKLSEDCPLTCLKAGDLLIEAGAPVEAFHLITGYGDAGEALVEHPDVPVITFTGSSAVGKLIMEKAGKHLKHLSLELGGNDPVIVFEDADLDLVAKNIVKGRMTVGNGQACVADKRFIVHRSIVDEITSRCVDVVKKLIIGNPIDPVVDVGPVISEKAAKRVEEMINDAVGKGAEVCIGGKRHDRTFIEPTILKNVTTDMIIANEECFGPVAPFLNFDSEEEALQLSNASMYGLQGAVYSKDISRALRVADELEVGGVVINGSSCFRPGNVPYMPRKQSGIGTDNMYNCYEEMTCGKAIVICDAVNRFL